MKVKGIIEKIYDTVQVTDTFKRRGFIVLHWNNPEINEFLSFEVIQDRCKVLDNFKKGDKVIVNFHLKGKKYTNPDGVEKYFNALQAWNIELDTSPCSFYDNLN